MSVKANKFNEYVDCYARCEKYGSTLLYGDQSDGFKPCYSFVVPTYKRSSMLKMALESILAQTAKIPYEVIVVDNDDDFCNVEVLRIIEQLNDNRILYYKNQQNLGACGNWNRGIELARCNWVIFLHDDDLLMNDYLEKMDEFIKKHAVGKNVGYIRAGGISFFGDGMPNVNNQGNESKGVMQKSILSKDKLRYRERTIKDVYLNGGIAWVGAPTYGAVLNREVFLKIGGFDKNYSPCPDCFAGYKVLREHRILHTSPATGYYRWSQNDTYNLNTLVGLVDRFEELLSFLGTESRFIRFFRDCFYYDTVNWMAKKAGEAGKTFDITQCKNYGTYKQRKARTILLHGIQKMDKMYSLLKMHC